MHILWCPLAVAAHLALYKFSLKTDPPSAFRPGLHEAVPEQLKFEPLNASEEWDAGVVAAKAQNLARTVSFRFMETSLPYPVEPYIFIADGTTCKYDDAYCESLRGRPC